MNDSERKKKVSLEFEMHSSVHILYEFIATSSGLSEWFADNVNSTREHIYHFYWGDSEERAELIESDSERMVRFQWELDKGTDYFFQMEIVVDDITSDVSLVITDFAKKGEEESLELYWTNLMEELKHSLGSV